MKNILSLFIISLILTIQNSSIAQDDFKSDTPNQTPNKKCFSIKEKFIKSLKYLKFRNGHLIKTKQSIIDQLIPTLQPLDILVEKSSFLITDKFIPGHFGHVALWLGDEKEYIKRSIWNHPVVQKNQKMILSNDTLIQHKNTIIEAVTNGVRLTTLDDFLDADDLVILRPTCVSGNFYDDTTAMLQALIQIGKEYDFDFDVHNKDKIICSELACICFPMINWEEIHFLGKRTVSPDNIVRTCLKENFEIVTFYHNGKECSPKKRDRLIRKLTRFLND